MYQYVLCVLMAAVLTFAQPTPVPTATPDKLPVIPESTIESIRLDRLGCLVRCRVYTLIFWSDGTAVYRGERYVDRIGTFAGTTDFAQVAAWLDSENVDSYNGA